MSRRQSLADIKDFNSRRNSLNGASNSRRVSATSSKRFSIVERSIAEEGGPEDNSTLEERFQQALDFQEIEELPEEDTDQEHTEITGQTRRRASIIISNEGQKLVIPAPPKTNETRNKTLSPEQKHEIIQIFQLFDTDGSGTMEISV